MAIHAADALRYSPNITHGLDVVIPVAYINEIIWKCPLCMLKNSSKSKYIFRVDS
jgi:hypothetical protein